MIQCVESRDDKHPYCSRVCCSHAIKNALKLKENYPHINIYILYRDIRTYGTRELYYKKAREKGINFIRYEKEQEPVVTVDDGYLNVRIREPFVGKNLLIPADMLVLSIGISALEENKTLSQLLKVPLNEDKFFLEAHVKLRPVDFATDGVFVCGLAHCPKAIDESIAQARAAAARACTILSKTRIEAEGKVAQVADAWCNGCGVCVAVCPFNALELDESKHIAVVNESLCKGCGTCSASCRQSAIDLKGFKNEQILAVLGAM
jgi:heterodisulfide reductase subunit A